MNSIAYIRSGIRRLYETDPHIHINVTLTHPKIRLENEPALIKAVYPHIFRIEENGGGSPKSYTLQYGDILTGQVEILELNGN